MCQLPAGFSTASSAITIYPSNSMAQGTASGFIDGVQYTEQSAGLTTAATGLKAIEVEFNIDYSDITGGNVGHSGA